MPARRSARARRRRRDSTPAGSPSVRPRPPRPRHGRPLARASLARVPKEYSAASATSSSARTSPCASSASSTGIPRPRAFFKQGARELPRPEYPPLGFTPKDKVKELRGIRRQIRGRNPLEDLLRRRCDELAAIAEMLSARGTSASTEISRRVYGDPRDRFPDHNVDNLAIARMWASRPRARDEELVYSADEAAAKVAEICNPLLGGHVTVQARARLTANAASGATRITLRKGARFSERQVRALATTKASGTSSRRSTASASRCSPSSASGSRATSSRRRAAASWPST